jgi:hypothetical protein
MPFDGRHFVDPGEEKEKKSEEKKKKRPPPRVSLPVPVGT